MNLQDTREMFYDAIDRASAKFIVSRQWTNTLEFDDVTLTYPKCDFASKPCVVCAYSQTDVNWLSALDYVKMWHNGTAFMFVFEDKRHVLERLGTRA